MKLRLTYWQMLPLFFPFIIGLFIEELPHVDIHTFQVHSAIFNILMVFNICLVNYYQALLVFGFIRDADLIANGFKVNVLIPIIFFSLYLIYVIYSTFIRMGVQNLKFKDGPLHRADLNPVTWTILLFIIYNFITYFFINNQFVGTRIKKITNVEKREQLTFDYRLPMRRLVRLTIWIYLSLLLITIIFDITKSVVNV